MAQGVKEGSSASDFRLPTLKIRIHPRSGLGLASPKRTSGAGRLWVSAASRWLRSCRLAFRLGAYGDRFRGQPQHASRSSLAGEERRQQVHAAETRLLYENATTGIAATLVIASLLAYAQWDAGRSFTVSAWLLYLLLVSAARFVLVRRYWRASPSETEYGRWRAMFVVGAAMAAVGWGAGAFVLCPAAGPMNKTLVVFAVGGVMLGSASLLAARPEAFVTFLLPTGFLTALRLTIEGDNNHLMMGFLAAVFTVVTVITTWRFHLAIESSLRLRFANHDLIESLHSAKNDAEALNRELERRVRDRSAKLIEADQRKDEFLATLAHELRNPLAPIRFALEHLKVDTPYAPATRAREVIERQVKQLVRLVDDLLDMSRITANKIQLRREPIELGRLMATAVESIMPLATEAGHTVEMKLPSTPVCVNGDGARLPRIAYSRGRARSARLELASLIRVAHSDSNLLGSGSRTGRATHRRCPG